MLQVSGIDAGYGDVQVLRDLSLSVAAGEVLCMLGRNGAGKTTTLKAIMGLARPRSGSIRLDGVELTRLPAHEVPRQGIAYVPQGRRLFAQLTVAENLEIGLMARGHGQDTLERVLALFPVLRERLDQRVSEHLIDRIFGHVRERHDRDQPQRGRRRGDSSVLLSSPALHDHSDRRCDRKDRRRHQPRSE